MGDCGGVEFAVGGGYDGFVVVYIEREVVDFLTAQSVYVALDHWVVAVWFTWCKVQSILFSYNSHVASSSHKKSFL